MIVKNSFRHQQPLSFAAEARPWLFLALTLGITWLMGFTAVALQEHLPNVLILGLAYGGSLAPLGVAVGLAWRHGRLFRRDFWRHLALQPHPGQLAHRPFISRRQQHHVRRFTRSADGHRRQFDTTVANGWSVVDIHHHLAGTAVQ